MKKDETYQQQLEHKNKKQLEPVEANTSIIDSIQALVLRPDIDLDRVDKYLGIQERIADKNAKIAFNHAFSQTQSEIPVIKRTKKNTFTNSSYAPYEEMMKHIQAGHRAALISMATGTGKTRVAMAMIDILLKT